MKKYYIHSLIALLFITSACESLVDIEQPGRLGAEQAYQTVNDLNAGLLGVYGGLDYSSQIKFNSVFTDMVSIGFDSGGQGIGNGEYGFRLNSQSAISIVLWTGGYAALNSATRLIEAASLIEPTEDEVDEYNDILGQAYALRAFLHFEMLSYFSPDLTDDTAPGIIVLDFIPSIDQFLPRNTTGEVFTAINSDIALAEGLLSEESNPTFVSLDFLTALKARSNAYRGNYAAADGFAAELLEKYPLADRDTYVAMFADEADGEVIFKIERTIGDNFDGQGTTASFSAGGWAGASFAFVNATIDGSPYYEMSDGLFAELSPEDIRYDVLVQETADLDAGIIPIGKYEGSESQPLMNDLKVFRASEMLFIRAEAAAAANNPTQAAAYIDELRAARFGSAQLPAVYPNATAAFKGILDERRIELAYEGFRWMSLKTIGALAGVTSLDRLASDCAVNGACTISLSDIRTQAVPIPLVELDANNVIGQTDGY